MIIKNNLLKLKEKKQQTSLLNRAFGPNGSDQKSLRLKTKCSQFRPKPDLKYITRQDRCGSDPTPPGWFQLCSAGSVQRPLISNKQLKKKLLVELPLLKRSLKSFRA